MYPWRESMILAKIKSSIYAATNRAFEFEFLKYN